MVDQNPSLHDRLNMPNGLSQTVTGRYVNLFDLQADEISLSDIANSLSKLCRYNGHTAGFISVAGHSIRCAQRALDLGRHDVALECLMHDAAEAYIGDLVRPIKHHPNFKQTYLDLEEPIERVLAEVFGLVYPFDPFVKEMDNAELQHELEIDRFNAFRWDDPQSTAISFIWMFETLKEKR